MKRPTYQRAIAFIALNDDPGEDYARDVEQVKCMVSVSVVAHLFNKTTLEVAQDIVEFRST